MLIKPFKITTTKIEEKNVFYIITIMAMFRRLINSEAGETNLDLGCGVEGRSLAVHVRIRRTGPDDRANLCRAANG